MWKIRECERTPWRPSHFVPVPPFSPVMVTHELLPDSHKYAARVANNHLALMIFRASNGGSKNG